MPPKRQLISFDNTHLTVIGTTQTGKTYSVTKSIEKVREGVLFFNTQHIPFSSKYVECNGSDDIQTVITALRRGEKINFIPSRETRWKQLVAIIKSLYDASEKHLLNIYLVVDEVHLAEKDALKQCIEVATTGIRWGMRAVFISQRPALINNTIMSQSMKFVMFRTNMEQKYLKDYGFPYDEINQKLVDGGEHSFVVYDFRTVEGAFKV